ncbi:MAG: NAD-dependent malic enzyme [Gemmatimonadales bacterium]
MKTKPAGRRSAGSAKRQVVRTDLVGQHLLEIPSLNAGTAYSAADRERFQLHGLLPPVVETLEQQCARCYHAYQRKTDNLERHIYLRALQDNNETLFCALVTRHLEEMAPVIYTPVVAEGCRHFSHIYRRPRGLFLSYPMRARMVEMLTNRPNQDVDVIVVTDGERILGIGDQGAGGMGIPIGKLSLYTLIGGVAPTRTLPITLDVGTNNVEALHDPEYIGWRHERIKGQKYWDFVEQFVRAVERTLPHVLLQWEDFAKDTARPILDLYRDRLCTFNDDIQGTAAVAIGALFGALKITGTRFRDQEVVILGAGSAGTGLAEYILTAMKEEGLSDTEGRRRFYLLNSRGLVHSGTTELSEVQRAFAQDESRVASWKDAKGQIPLAHVIKNTRATILMGLSTRPGMFTRDIVQEMASKVERPIIFPLSNPADKAEAAPADLIAWTDGRAIVAAGSPFAPVTYGGRVYPIAQCNNFYIFPAIGLAVAASRTHRVTDAMMLAAARALGDLSPALKDRSAPLLPPLDHVKEVAKGVALAAAMEAVRARLAPRVTEDRMRKVIADRFWVPQYPEYRRDGKH